MSHAVMVDYGGIALRLEASCEEVESRLQELDERVERLRSTSTSVADSALEGALSSIEEARKSKRGEASITTISTRPFARSRKSGRKGMRSSGSATRRFAPPWTKPF